jgi:membrane protease YdiL (CAAX protease family)/Fe-S-cluster-containing hydrogenase component 2
VSDTAAHLSLHPERCDQCGRCERACPKHAINVGPSYILVDWHVCDGCYACIEACDRDAIRRAVVTKRTSAASAPIPVGEVSKVVVGSRAEAKAVRKAAEDAAKASAKSKVVKFSSKSTRAAVAAAAVGSAKSGAQPASAAAAGLPQDGTDAGGGSPPGAAAWTMPDLAVVLAVLLLTVLAKDAVFALPAIGLMPPTGKTIVRAVVLIIYYSIQLAFFAWLAQRHGAWMLDAFGLRRGQSTVAARSERPSRAGTAGLVVLLFLGTEAFAIGYGLAMQTAGLAQPVRLSSDLTMVFGSGMVGVVLSVVLVALVAPFAEELAFRGVVLPVLGNRWGLWPAVVVSATVYAAYHFSVWMFAPTFVLGIALGWLAWTRRSLWAAVWLHVLYNAAAVAAGYLIAR